jgi:menaquinone-dependent protoporphyrinogen oxidase
MTVLVAAASRHGATYEIADAIGQALEERGLDVQVVAAEDVEGVAGYEAVVIGSGVYAGHWLEPARRLVDEHRDELVRIPTWLFSSGPIGDPPRPDEEHAVHVDDLLQASGARGHRVFAGRLERHGLGLTERAMVFAFRAPEGDYRNWDEIGAWAAALADELQD